MLVFLIGLAFLVAGAAFVVAGIRAPAIAAQARTREFLETLSAGEEIGDEFDRLLDEPFAVRVLRPFAESTLRVFAGVLPGNYRDRVQHRLVLAGMATRYHAEEIITAQVLGAAVGLIVAMLLGLFGLLPANIAILALVALPLVGAQLPRSVIDRRADARQAEIRRDLPDTLDLLAISVEAGVGFEGALGIVSDNFDSALADELSLCLREMELGLPRRQALDHLRHRTEVPELSNFILTLTQADALGMPIGRVLKTQSAEMRTRRRQWARERAAKLPVKILFPLLPVLLSTFIVVLGPAIAQIGDAFG